MLRLSLLWIGWCAVHSLLITTRVRLWIEARGGAWRGGYRLGYVAFALISLLGLTGYTAALPQHPLPAPPAWLLGLQALLFVGAMVLFIGGLRVYDLQSFLGLRQWRAYRSGQPEPVIPFRATGILAYVRHPWYSGGIALLWSLPGLTDVTLVVRTILTFYLVIGTLLEERKLKASIGEPYRDYCRRVPMLLPWKLPR